MVIFCGGRATRLGNLTIDTPKSLIKIEGKPFLEYQIEILKKQSIKDVILCVGYLSEKIIEHMGDGKKFGVNIRYSYDDKKPLGPIGALKNAEPLLDNVFFIMYGDSYLFADFKKIYSYFLKHDDLALMVTYKNFDKYDTSNLVIKNGRIFAYGKENKTKDMIYIDYGTSILRKKVLALIPKDTYYSMVPFCSDLIKRKQLLAFEAKKRFYHIGTPEALEEFNDYIRGLD